MASPLAYTRVCVYNRNAIAKGLPQYASSMRFTIQYFRGGKRPKPQRFDLASFEEARQVALIAGEFPEAAVRSFTITSTDGRTETWFYRDGTWRQKRR
jgi:hypothetical protein